MLLKEILNIKIVYIDERATAIAYNLAAVIKKDLLKYINFIYTKLTILGYK